MEHKSDLLIRTTFERNENYVRELVFILFAQKWRILFTATLVYAAVLLIAFFWPPTYSAKGALLVKGKTTTASPQSLESELARPTPVSEEDVNSEVQIFLSDDNIRRTILRLREQGKMFTAARDEPRSLPVQLAKDAVKAVKGVLKREVPPLEGVDLEMLSLIVEVRSALQVNVVPASNVIDVRVRAGDPAAALVLLETLMNTYLTQRRVILHPERMGDFFADRVRQYLIELEAKRSEIMELVSRASAPDPVAELQNNLIQKRNVQEELGRLENERLAVRGELEHLAAAVDSGGIQLFAFVDNETIRSMAAELQSLTSAHAKALLAYDADSQTVTTLEHQRQAMKTNITREVRLLRDQVEGRLETLGAQIDNLEARLRALDARNVELRGLQLELEAVRRETELVDFSYQTFYKRSEEAAIGDRHAASGLDSQVVILTPARANLVPDFPKRKVLLPFGLVLAVLVGVCMGFASEFFDHTFKRPEDVERVTRLPVILSIPELGGRHGRRARGA